MSGFGLAQQSFGSRSRYIETPKIRGQERGLNSFQISIKKTRQNTTNFFGEFFLLLGFFPKQSLYVLILAYYFYKTSR